eukprot:TRINITY_DN19705_c0_g1_i2.p1 TRINITY_DN19705_c0_g1~~TRINITY_DN19705_c0_g1_i2.p1  ORF type:complete len:460 (-),score=108.35 TRINITY_DN19705_c0_g1_i2:359-1738(-)
MCIRDRVSTQSTGAEMTTSHELARWRAAKARRSPLVNSPLIPFKRIVSPVKAEGSILSPEPVEDYAAQLEGCTFIQVDSVATTVEGTRENNIRKAVDGSASTYYCGHVEPDEVVEVQLMLAGRFQVRKLDLYWKHPPDNFSVQFSRWDGDRFTWINVSENQRGPDTAERQEIFIGKAGFAHHTGTVRLLMKADPSQMVAIADIQIFGMVAPVALKRAEASSEFGAKHGTKEYGAHMLCNASSSGWHSSPNPEQPVVVHLELSGRFHVRKMVIRWSYNGPHSFRLAFSPNGREDSWYVYPPEETRAPVQSVILTQDFYEHSTGVVRLELTGQNHPKYVGIAAIEILGDLDIAWRNKAIEDYERVTASPSTPRPLSSPLSSPKSSGKHHKAPARDPKPVVPVPKPLFVTTNASTESSSALSSPAVGAEVVALRAENVRLRAEVSTLRDKLREAKRVIESVL